MQIKGYKGRYGKSKGGKTEGRERERERERERKKRKGERIDKEITGGEKEREREKKIGKG